MLDTSIQVHTDSFDGPLGLLLMLVQREEMDVRDLDLTKITKQYLDYLSQMRELNFDVAGEYLYLAATLLLLKSKTCITEEEASRLKEKIEGADELNINSHSELVRRLEELEHFQRMGEKLWQLPRKNEDIFVRPKVNRKEIVNSILSPIELDKLTLAMMDLIQKNRRKYQVVRRDRLSIKEKLEFLKDYLQEHKKTNLEDLVKVHGDEGIDNIVITFISLLELARLGRLNIFQNEGSKMVYAEVIKSLDDFDVNQASGFDDEEEQNQVSEEDLELEEIIVQSSDDTIEINPDSDTLIQ